MKLHICTYVRVICVNNKLLAGRKCDISVCTADIFKPRDYLVRGKSVFSYCGIISLTRPDYTFSRRATFSPDAFITSTTLEHNEPGFRERRVKGKELADQHDGTQTWSPGVEIDGYLS